MKLKQEEIAKLGQMILRNLRDKSIVTLKGTDTQAAGTIAGAIARNLEEEQRIEDEVRRIMEQYKSQIASGTIDPQKAYMMIKKQVAKERKFVL